MKPNFGKNDYIVLKHEDTHIVAFVVVQDEEYTVVADVSRVRMKGLNKPYVSTSFDKLAIYENSPEFLNALPVVLVAKDLTYIDQFIPNGGEVEYDEMVAKMLEAQDAPSEGETTSLQLDGTYEEMLKQFTEQTGIPKSEIPEDVRSQLKQIAKPAAPIQKKKQKVNQRGRQNA